MTRLYLLSIAATLLGAITVSVPAFAAFTCEVGFTGPNSQNMCESVTKYECSVDNENIVIIDSSTNQVAYSGSATVEDNGSGGGASTGSVTNDSGTTFTVSISNGGGSEQEPATCLASVVVPATENPEPGRGETEVPVQPAQKVTPQTLPVTSGSPVPALLTILASGVLLGACVAAYRRIS